MANTIAWILDRPHQEKRANQTKGLTSSAAPPPPIPNQPNIIRHDSYYRLIPWALLWEYTPLSFTNVLFVPHGVAHARWPFALLSFPLAIFWNIAIERVN